jgi:hypothetical protein
MFMIILDLVIIGLLVVDKYEAVIALYNKFFKKASV